MAKKYTSSTLADIRQSTRSIYQQLDAQGFARTVSEKYGLNINAVRNAIEGKPAKAETLNPIVSEFEKMAGLKPKKSPPRKIRGYSIAQLYTECLFPAKFADLAAAITGAKPNAVAYFVKNQVAGKDAYASSAETIAALYQIAEENEEWELLCRLQRVMEKLDSTTG